MGLSDKDYYVKDLVIDDDYGIIDSKATLLSKPDSFLARSFPNLFADQLCFLLKGTSNDSTKN